MDEDIIIEILKRNNVGLTKPRMLIMHYLVAQAKAFISLRDILRMPDQSVNRTTLYRTLLLFCEAGLLYKIIDVKNRVLYGLGKHLKSYITTADPAIEGNYHFQCKTCHTVFCLPNILPPPQLPEGFVKINSNLLLMGYCASCSAKSKNVSRYHNINQN